MARQSYILTIALAVNLLVLHHAGAVFHFYDFTEVYSNADGTIQFIEMSTEVNNQHLFDGHSITSNENTFVFMSDLPSSATAGTSFLLATSGFAALPGAVTPDFIIPDNFFSVESDTLTLVGGNFAPISWSAGGLPTDGVNSLNRAIGGGTSHSTAVNSPTNFAGQSGSIDLSGGDEEPTEIHVDFAAEDGGDGTLQSPFNTLAAAVDAVPDSGTILIAAGHSDEAVIVDVAKQFLLEAVGGVVTIGSSPPSRGGFRSRSSLR